MFSVDQIDSRIVDKQDYSYSYFRLTIGRMKSDSIEFIDNILSPERNIFLEQTLTAGEYLILVEPYFATKHVDSYNIGTYSDQLVNLSLINVDETKYNYCEYLIWKDFFIKNMQKDFM